MVVSAEHGDCGNASLDLRGDVEWAAGAREPGAGAPRWI